MSKLSDTPELSETHHERFNDVLFLARTCGYEENHTRQVARLALQIFDQLRGLTKLGLNEKFYLLCAAYLHDIGVSTEGKKGHHKVAMQIILSTPLLHFDSKERLIIASIARYHRKALPSEQHSHYRALNDREKQLVNILAGILRIADGLDYRHDGRVQNVILTMDDQSITIKCLSDHNNISPETASASRKAELLERTLKRTVKIL